MVKEAVQAPSRPAAATKPELEVAVGDLNFDCQFHEWRKAARLANLDNAVAELKSRWRKRRRRQKVLSKDADEEERICELDVKRYAAFLLIDSGADREQPWIKKLLEVSEKRLDPCELLKIYRENPGSLVANLYNPGHYRMTPEIESTPPLHSISRCAALRALVGKDNWRESPALHFWVQKAQEVTRAPLQALP